MLTINRTMRLHIFPTAGAWTPTDQVLVIVTVNDMPVSESYNITTLRRGETIVDRDYLFGALSLPSVKDQYEDIIMYRDPYTEMWCEECECPRYPIPTGHPAGGHTCDACGQFIDLPF
jgi:hypothetical protein